jgi:predicted secreted hydrolase
MSKRTLLITVLALTGAVLAGWWLYSDRGGHAGRGAPAVDVGELLGAAGGTEGYAIAVEPREFVFPRDHGAHPDFRNEWWYFTGNLRGGDGSRFGYQLTVFRSALGPRPRGGASAWATRQAYMGHLAVTDAGAGRFRYFERFSRGAAGLAGARSDGMSVWIEDWSVTATGNGAWRLKAAAGEGADAVALDLTLDPVKPIVLQGDRGLSRKGGGAGNASYNYSHTRIATRGTVDTAGATREVEGTSWMDREWSTGILEAGQVGWDWFSVQLENGGELMFYRLRRAGGTPDPHSQGVWVLPDGTTVGLADSEVAVDALDRWQSPRGGDYPAGWRIRVPRLSLDLELRPVLEDQELDLLVRYWEGAVDVTGRHGAQDVAGWGYVELTGYTATSFH